MPSLKTSLAESGLSSYLFRQVRHAFPDGEELEQTSLLAIIPHVLERVEHCFSRVNNRYFFDGKQPIFNHLHSDQYAMFLYLASNTAYRLGIGESAAAKIFLLNKMLHGVDVFYEVELPDVFLFVHPLGTVLGRGSYSDYMMVYQRCGIGSNHERYPRCGSFLTLRPGSAVYGDCEIGSNCTIAAESYVLDSDLQDNLVYIGNPRSFTTRPAMEKPSIWRVPG